MNKHYLFAYAAWEAAGGISDLQYTGDSLEDCERWLKTASNIGDNAHVATVNETGGLVVVKDYERWLFGINGDGTVNFNVRMPDYRWSTVKWDGKQTLYEELL